MKAIKLIVIIIVATIIVVIVIMVLIIMIVMMAIWSCQGMCVSAACVESFHAKMPDLTSSAKVTLMLPDGSGIIGLRALHILSATGTSFLPMRPRLLGDSDRNVA